MNKILEGLSVGVLVIVVSIATVGIAIFHLIGLLLNLIIQKVKR